MDLNRKWSQQVILEREKYIKNAIMEDKKVFNELPWPKFDIGDDVANKDFTRSGRIKKVYCSSFTLVKVIIVDGEGRNLAIENPWNYVVEWADGEVEHTLGYELRED